MAMSQRSLESLLRPKSIAIIGASNKVGRNGHLIMQNLLKGGFSGPVMPVTPRYQAVCGVLAYPDIESLPLLPTSPFCVSMLNAISKSSPH